MIAHNLGLPEGQKKEYCNEEGGLASYDIDHLEKFGIEEAWYWYALGSYEGTGMLLMRIGDLYYLESLSHCSCNSPVHFYKLDRGKSLEDLERDGSEEYRNAWATLLAKARGE